MTKQNIPSIRFKGFDGEWENIKLKDSGKFVRESIFPNNFPDLVYQEYSMPSFDANKTPSTVLGKTMMSNRLVIDETVLLINKLNVRQKRIWLVENPKENSVSSAEFMPFKSTKLDLKFLQQYLLSDPTTRYLDSISTGTSNSQKRVTPDDLLNYIISVGSIAEQSQIGSLFSTIDSLLSSYKDNLENYQFFKKTMLSKMFPKAGQNVPEIRLDGFEGKWIRVKMGDVFSQKVDYIEPDEKNELWSLTVEKGLTPKIERYKRDFLVKKTDKFKRVKPNDFAYNPMNLTLGSLDANQLGKSISVSGYYVVMSIEDYSKYDIDYFKILLKTSFAIFQYKQYATGTLIEKQRVQFPIFSDISFALPSLPEQRAIGSFFSNLDDLISSYQNKIDELETLKKKLLQDMFI